MTPPPPGAPAPAPPVGPEPVATARRRLHRIQGQLSGIVAMLDQGRPCDEVIGQIAAAGKALDRVGVSLLVAQLQYCLDEPEAAASQGYEPARVERLFMSLT